MSIAYYECVFVAFVIWHAKRMRHTDICGLSGSTIFFPHYLKKWSDFRETKFIEYKICILILSAALSETILILRITERHVIKKVYLPSYKVPVIFVRF